MRGALTVVECLQEIINHSCLDGPVKVLSDPTSLDVLVKGPTWSFTVSESEFRQCRGSASMLISLFEAKIIAAMHKTDAQRLRRITL